MPYADPSEQREFNRNLFLRRYQSDPEFREDEALRKARWYELNRAKVSERKKIYYKNSRRRSSYFQLGEVAEACLL